MTISDFEDVKSAKTDAQRSLNFRNRIKLKLENIPRDCRVWKCDHDGILIGTARGNDGWKFLAPYPLFATGLPQPAPPWLRTRKQRDDYNRRMVIASKERKVVVDIPDIPTEDQFRYSGRPPRGALVLSFRTDDSEPPHSNDARKRKPIKFDNDPIYDKGGNRVKPLRPYAKRKPQELVQQSEIDGWPDQAREKSKALNYRCPPMGGYCCRSASGLNERRAPREMKMAA